MEKNVGITKEEVLEICKKNNLKSDTSISAEGIATAIYESIQENNRKILESLKQHDGGEF